MNSTSITSYILELEKLNEESRTKIEQLKKLLNEANKEKVAALNKLNSLYDTTTRVTQKCVNQGIVDRLLELGEMTSDFYKAGAYQAAANVISSLDYEVESGESVLHINGIGKGIANKIDEYLEEQDPDYEESVASSDECTSDSESVASNDEFFVSYNKELADVLDSLCYYETDEFKKKAYDDAAYTVYKLPFKVTDGDELARGPNKVPGIGKSIAAKINEFLETGKVKKLERLKRVAAVFEKTASICPLKKLEKQWSVVDETHDDYFAGGHNDALVRHLKNMASEESDEFKAAAYEKAADAIDTLNFKVTNGEELSKGPKKVPGIGKSIVRKIDDFLASQKKVSFELESNPVSTNEEIAWALNTCASEESDPHKIRAYKRAAEIIGELDFEVTSGEELAKGPHKIEGIGKGIAKKIDEFLQTGEIKSKSPSF
jgi:DNA polymerase/3'-5' exonuclease PolX